VITTDLDAIRISSDRASEIQGSIDIPASGGVELKELRTERFRPGDQLFKSVR